MEKESRTFLSEQANRHVLPRLINAGTRKLPYDVVAYETGSSTKLEITASRDATWAKFQTCALRMFEKTGVVLNFPYMPDKQEYRRGTR